MRKGRFTLRMLAFLTAMTLSWAAAAEAPEAVAARLTAGDGDIIVTDARGVIVGVGTVVVGASFELRVLEGFVGPARLTLLRRDGTTETLDIVVDGRVRVEGFDLLELLDERVEAYTVEVGGLVHGRTEGRGAREDVEAGEGQRAGDPPGPPDAPGPPRSPEGPSSPGPRGPDGRP